MRIEDVKVGMMVKTNSNVGDVASGYVTPNDIGKVVKIKNSGRILVKWNNPQIKADESWWIEVGFIEPYVETKLKKENIKMEEKLSYEGWIRCSKADGTPRCKVGDWYRVDSVRGIKLLDSNWMCESSNIDAGKLLNKHTKPLDAINEYMSRFNTQFDEFSETNPLIKTKTPILSTKVNVKVDLLFDSPIEGSHKDGKFIFYGRMTIFVSNEGKVGYAMVHPKELNTYNKETGQALAYWRAMNE